MLLLMVNVAINGQLRVSFWMVNVIVDGQLRVSFPMVNIADDGRCCYSIYGQSQIRGDNIKIPV